MKTTDSYLDGACYLTAIDQKSCSCGRNKKMLHHLSHGIPTPDVADLFAQTTHLRASLL